MKKKLSLLMIALVALASYAVQQITRASEPETIFSATVIATSDQNFDAGTTEIAATQATITGGKMYAVNNQTSAKKLIGKKTNYYFSMTNNNTYFKVVLDKALAVGDVITADALAGQKTSGDPATNKGIFVSTTEVTNGNFTVKPACQGIDGNEGSDAVIEGLLKYTVTEGDEYVDKTELYIYRAAGATEYFGNFKITREVQEEEPANELTLPGTAIWSSDEAQVVDWNNSKSIQISKEAFANVKAGDVLHVGILDAPEYAANGNWSYQIALQELGSWKNIESGITLQQPGDYVQDYVITGDMLAFMKTYGIAVNGTKFNVKKVTVESKYNGTDESIWLGEETLSGWNNFTVSSTHFYNANNFAGVKAGQIIRVTAKIPAEGSNMTFQYNGTAENDYAWTKYVDDANSFATPTGYEMVVTEDMVEYLNGRGLILCADGGIKVTQIELITPAEPESDGIVISPTGGDIYTALAAEIGDQTEYGNITINLTEGAEYTISSSIVAPASITINGNGATIDASALEGNFIEMAVVESPTEWTEANVTIKDVTVKGLKKALFYSACKNYYGDFTVDNSVVELAADATTFDYTKGSTAVNFTVTNSTFYAPTATTKSFYSSQSGQKTTEYDGTAKQTFKFTNNTMYNLAPSKNFFSHRQSNQTWYIYDVKNNIFVNCGKSSQVIKGMNGGQGGANPTWDIDGNIFNFNGADTSADESTGDEDEPVKNSIEGVITFTSVETPDFGGELSVVLAPAAETIAVGDPRWTITPKQVPVDIVISPAEDEKDIATALAAAEEGKIVKDITINLTEGAEYTISSSIVAPASITIKGNGATIDASALEAAMITTPAGDLDEWMEGNFTIKDVTIKGLAKSLFVSAGKNYLYNDFLIDNSVIEFNETAGFEFDFRKGGVAKNFMINTSTLYAPTATTNSLYTSQSAQKGTDAPGVTYQMFSITNSTLYNFAKGKNFFTHRQSNQKWLVYNINNSIFVDCGKSGQVVKGINQGQSGANPIWSIDGNIFNFGGADTSADESTGDEDEPVKNSIEGVITFTSVETPDFGGKFVLAEGATAPETMPGDPRWTINPIDITALKAEIETAKELLSEDADVTVDPEKTLNNAITAAETALETAESQEAVDKAVETLKAAEAKYQALTSDVPEFTPAITVNAIDGDDLYEKLEEAYDGMGRNPATIDIIIPDGATVTVSQTLETKNAIRIYSNGTGTIDASSLSGPMVKAIGIVDDEMPLKALDVNNNFCGNFISWVEFKNLNIAGLKTQLFYANKKAYFIPSVLVDNCVIEIKDASKKTLIDFNGGGVVETLTVQNSTIYGSTGNTWQNGAFFSSQSGKNITDAGSNKIQSFILKNNTFYNFAYKVTVSSLRSNSQKYLKFDVENNIIVDCGKEGQFIKGLNSGANGNTNPAWYVNNNSFLWTDANGKLTDISSKETTGDQYEDVGNSVGLTNDPAEIEEVFPMLEEYPGNFCLATEFCKQRDAQIGDPRWLADPTGVSTLKATITGDADSYYNLQGQKVSNLKRGGVYIKNGRKVVIK